MKSTQLSTLNDKWCMNLLHLNWKVEEDMYVVDSNVGTDFSFLLWSGTNSSNLILVHLFCLETCSGVVFSWPVGHFNESCDIYRKLE